jgi:hypothetical protein
MAWPPDFFPVDYFPGDYFPPGADAVDAVGDCTSTAPLGQCSATGTVTGATVGAGGGVARVIERPLPVVGIVVSVAPLGRASSDGIVSARRARLVRDRDALWALGLTDAA